LLVAVARLANVARARLANTGAAVVAVGASVAIGAAVAVVGNVATAARRVAGVVGAADAVGTGDCAVGARSRAWVAAVGGAEICIVAIDGRARRTARYRVTGFEAVAGIAVVAGHRCGGAGAGCRVAGVGGAGVAIVAAHRGA